MSNKRGLEVQRRYKGGDLIRTWHRLVCHTLIEVIVLDFRGMEVQRCGGGREARRGTSSERMGEWRRHMEKEWWRRKTCGIM